MLGTVCIRFWWEQIGTFRHSTPPTVQAGAIFSQPFVHAIMPYVWVNDYDVQKWWVVIQCGCANLLVVWAILLGNGKRNFTAPVDVDLVIFFRRDFFHKF